MHINNWRKMSIEEIIKDLNETSDNKPMAQIITAQVILSEKINYIMVILRLIHNIHSINKEKRSPQKRKGCY